MSILRILGNHRKLCDGISRRDLIQAGALSLFGLTLGDLLQLEAVQAASGAVCASVGDRVDRRDRREAN